MSNRLMVKEEWSKLGFGDLETKNLTANRREV